MRRYYHHRRLLFIRFVLLVCFFFVVALGPFRLDGFAFYRKDDDRWQVQPTGVSRRRETRNGPNEIESKNGFTGCFFCACTWFDQALLDLTWFLSGPSS